MEELFSGKGGLVLDTAAQLVRFKEPFPHSFLHPVFDGALATTALRWLEGYEKWHQNTKEFYDAESFMLGVVDLPEAVRPLVSRQLLAQMRLAIEDCFEVSPSDNVEVWASRIVPGKGVGVHSDFTPGEVRVTVQLNSGWKLSNGGMLVLFSEHDEHAFERVYLPLHNSAIIFPTSPVSFHAVSEVTDGTRYTLVYLFRPQESRPSV